MEINSDEHFSYDIFFREWNHRPCGMEMPLHNHQEKCLWVERSSGLYQRFFMVYWMIIGVIPFSFLKTTTVFCWDVSCWLPACQQTSRLPFWDTISLSCRLNRLNKRSRWDEWQDMVWLCSLIHFNWQVRWPRPARVPLFSLKVKVFRFHVATSGGC